MKHRKPAPLKPGSRIAIAAISSPFDSSDLERGVTLLKSMGFESVLSTTISEKNGYLAGSDDRRLSELQGYINDPDIDAILFARGGYGSQRILPQLDVSALHQYPKLIIGYSDLTPLLSMLGRHGIAGACYGPTVARHFFDGASPQTIKWWKTATSSPAGLGAISIPEMAILREGAATAPLAGGCLTLLSTSIGTPYDIPDGEHILLIEDVGETLYRIDRMLTHLKHAGAFRHTQGIIFGSLPTNEATSLSDVHQRIIDILHDFPGPIVGNIPFGHLPFDAPTLTLPLGLPVTLDTSRRTIEWHEGAVA